MKEYKPKFEVSEDPDEARERRAKDMRAMTEDQTVRQQETARRHTRFDDKRRKGTRRAVSKLAIRESME